MPQERLLKQGFLPKQMREDQVDDLDVPITMRILDGNCLKLFPSEMMEVMEDREVWRINLKLLLPLTLTEKWAMKKEGRRITLNLEPKLVRKNKIR